RPRAAPPRSIFRLRGGVRSARASGPVLLGGAACLWNRSPARRVPHEPPLPLAPRVQLRLLVLNWGPVAATGHAATGSTQLRAVRSDPPEAGIPPPCPQADASSPGRRVHPVA